MRRLLPRIRAVLQDGLSDLVRAQRALLRARRRVATEPIGALAVRAPFEPGEARGDRGRAYQLARAVGRASRFGLFRPYCLVRVVALRDLLERDGITGSSIRIGVRRADGRFEAHAWLVWGRELLGDSVRHVRTFTEVDDLRVIDRR